MSGEQITAKELNKNPNLNNSNTSRVNINHLL